MFYKRWLWIIGILLVSVCHSACRQVLADKITIDKMGWDKDRYYQLNFDIHDTINRHHLILHLNHSEDYGFDNLFLIGELEYPNGVTEKDTLEYAMADLTGRFLGAGWNDKNILLYYREAIKLPQKGHYRLRLNQAMRKRNELQGIKSLKNINGIGIEIKALK